jgi:nucleoside-diphosphate-sugar epimerase
MTRILITGAAGYLGSILCEHLLDAGHHVTAVDNIHYNQNSLFHLCANPDFRFIRGDARDGRVMAALVREADGIIPLAAIVGATACDRDPLMAESLNFGAIELLNRLRSRNQLVIYPNTNSGYGTQTGEHFCTEATPLEPISLYGKTKCRAERLLLDSPNAITLRLATVFGASPRMRIDLLVNHFAYAAVTDGYIVIFEKDFKRNYIHVRDVADAFLHCLGHSAKMIGRPYNAGLDETNLSKEELASKVKEHVPDFYIHFAELGSDPDRRNYIVSNERLRQAGFEARRSLDDGITELLKLYRMIGIGRFQNA